MLSAMVMMNDIVYRQIDLIWYGVK